MLRIYCDGIFDLFHSGHLKHLKKIHDSFETNVYLIVGVINDKTATQYKRKPIFTQKQRKKILDSCLYVNKVLVIDKLLIDEYFLTKYNIDFVVHAFANKEDIKKQEKFFKIPIKLNKFKIIPYNHGISTTQIIKEDNLNWNDIWEKKGLENTDNLALLGGWELTDFNPINFVKRMVKLLNINANDSIYEVGCSAGLLAQYLNNYDYIGIDKSSSLVAKHIKLLSNCVCTFSSTEIIFKNKYFDFTICNGMLEYLSNLDELYQTIVNIERVTKQGIYIGCIREKTHTNRQKKHKYNGVFKHLTIPRQYFIDKGYTIIECIYCKDERYDAYKLNK